MLEGNGSTPAAESFWMPAEWSPHAGCLMAWPVREELWRGRLNAAKQDYAAVARAVAQFEPVVMVCLPGQAREVRDVCGSAQVRPLELPIDDSWARDSGPIFVRDPAGEVAVVQFGFNAWGGRWHPHGDDALLATRVGRHFGLRVFKAPFVLEGGAFFVDGEGTLLTTEQCVLNPNRNPHLTREQLEQGFHDYLGVTRVVWLPFGHSADVGPTGTDGHIDGVAQFVGSAHVLLEAPTSPKSPEHLRSQQNLARLNAAADACERPFQVSLLDPGADPEVSYANHYLANGAVIVPVTGGDEDAVALKTLASIYAGREIVPVPGMVIGSGGGGPHCITQQIPAGVDLH